MNRLIKKIFWIALRIAFLFATAILIPISFLLVLEYVCPMLGLFPFYGISLLSILWIGVLSVCLIPQRIKSFSRKLGLFGNISAKFNNPLSGLPNLSEYLAKLKRLTDVSLPKLKLPDFLFRQNDDREEPKRTQSHTEVNRRKVPTGILMIIKRKKNTQPKVLVANIKK